MLDKALALAALGIYVFPCRKETTVENGTLRKEKSPYVPGGFNDGTTDEQQIRSWWSKWPHATVGVWAGKSELVCLDIDQKLEDENGVSKDGWYSLFEAGLADELDDSLFNYPTKSGGNHYLFSVPDGAPRLGPTVKHPLPKGFEVPGAQPADGLLHDVDRRAGASYFIWWADEVPADRDVFKPAPAWLLTEARSSEEKPFEGSVDDWFAQCEPGEPKAYLKQILVDLHQKQGRIDHEIMRDTQRLLIAHATSGQPGVPEILTKFRELYIDHPGNDWPYQFDTSLKTGIEKFGAFPPTIADAHQVKVANVLAKIKDPMAVKAWAEAPAGTTTEAYRTRVRYLISHALKDGATLAEAAAFGLASEARKCRSMHSLEWLPEQWVWLAAQQAQDRPVLSETPDEVVSTLPQLLSASERQRAGLVQWFGSEFMEHIRSINRIVTEPYFRLTRWVLLSCFFGDIACLRQENRVSLPLNIYGILAGPSGCIQGDAEIVINRAGNGRRIKLKDLVAGFNGERTGSARWNPEIPTMVQREMPDGTIRLAELANAWYSGKKNTYTVTTDTGRTIRATDEHPFLTERGWLRLDELQVDDLVHVRGDQKGAGSQRDRGERRKYRRLSCGPYHPYGKGKDRKSGWSVCEHRLVAEATLNGLTLDEFLARVKTGDIEGLEFLPPSRVVHHLDGNTLNNEPDNLEVVDSQAEHAAHHGEEFVSNVLYKATTERVVSVEYFGVEDTYDLEVVGDPHNFIANGFVVHNTGKSEALAPLFAILKEAGISANIGGDATSAGLTEVLIERNGKVSFFNADEADGVIRKWKDNIGPFADMKQKITEFYGGRVPPMQRSTKKDLSGIEATAILNAILVGVDEKIIDAIDPDDWISGFINRFVFAQGERKVVSARDVAPRFVSADERPAISGGTTWESAWASRFNNARLQVSAGVPNDMRQWISMTKEVEGRHYKMIEQLEHIAARSTYRERLEPTFTRLRTTIAKCAALVACSNGRIVIEMDDYLVALEQGQEWLENALAMVKATLKNSTARQADKLYDLIVMMGGFAKRSEIHRLAQFEGRRKFVDELLLELEAQGRIQMESVTGTPLVRTMDEIGA